MDGKPQFRRHREVPVGWDLSCQYLTAQQLTHLQPQLERASIHTSVKDHERFFIDVSFNELRATDLRPLAEIIEKLPNVDICVSDNPFSWDDLRSWLEDQYRDIGLRWVKDARLTMASTPRHSLVGQIMVNQAITTANIAKATAAIASVAKENKNTHGWKLHVGFGLEDEVNKAVQLALTDEGYTNINALDFFKAIKGLDGKDEYNFDGVFEATKEDDNYLFVGETKQYLEGHIVLDAEADRQKLADCLLGVRMSQSQVGARSYNSQTKQLQEYTGFTVLLYVRGCRVLPGTIENAKRVKCVIVQPSGAGMQMTIF